MSFIKALLDGSPIMRLAAANPGAINAPDGSPVIAAELVTAAPASGKPVVAGSVLLNEGQPLRYYDVFPGGTVQTPDGRYVIALLLVDATGAIAGGALDILTAPTVAGDNIVGEFLYATHGTYGVVPDSITSQWYRDGAAIPGALYDYYQQTDADNGTVITYGEIAHKAGYADSLLNMAA